jgi:polyketide biosynthesis acyl carrier protein
LEPDRLTWETDVTQEEIFDIVIRHAREVVPGLEEHRFQPSESLKELGANSMDRSEIVMMTLESLALTIPLVETARARNIGELVSVLHEKL